MKQPKIEWTDDIDFSFHIEGSEVVIDKCEGVEPEEGLAMFPDWAIEAAAKSADWSVRYPKQDTE